MDTNVTTGDMAVVISTAPANDFALNCIVMVGQRCQHSCNETGEVWWKLQHPLQSNRGREIFCMADRCLRRINPHDKGIVANTSGKKPVMC